MMLVAAEAIASSENQGQSVDRAGRKGATKVFKHGRKSPWVPNLNGLFPNGDWAQKLVCIIVPNRRTASSEFFS